MLSSGDSVNMTFRNMASLKVDTLIFEEYSLFCVYVCVYVSS